MIKKSTKDTDANSIDTVDKHQTNNPSPNVKPEESEDQRPAKRRFSKQRLFIAGAVVILAVALGSAVPFLRYGVTGLFVHKTVGLTVIDEASGKPVSGVKISFGRVDTTTDKAGRAKIDAVAVGSYYVKAEKKYYAPWSGSILVPLLSKADNNTIKLKATGRSVNVTVSHSITGKPVADATVSIGDTSAITDAKGIAAVVVAVGSKVASGTIKAENYVDAAFAIDVQARDDQSVSAKVTPVGRLYYLSKATGTINLMSSNLDGSDAKVVIAGTGRENDNDTLIRGSSDWKYIMLYANREGKQRPYVYNTENGSFVKIDDEDGYYSPTGWAGNALIYELRRDRNIWVSGSSAIKSYAASSKKLTTVAESQASGTGYYDYVSEAFTRPIIMEDRIIYGSEWNANANNIPSDKKTSIMSAQLNGVKMSLKDFDATQYSLGMPAAYSPLGIYFPVNKTDEHESQYYTVANGKVSQANVDAGAYQAANIRSYQLSPSKQKTAWSEQRDGQDYVFIADGSGRSQKQLSPIGYNVYGWYGEEYLLLTKNSSELYVYPIDASTDQPVKVTNYHRPSIQWGGMGYGAS